ncbi:sensory transduction protein LytT [Filimonas sp.]|nr:sensory transduction protein LytT [Filimonas sp.]
MKALIIDDDGLNIELIENFCKKYAPSVEVVGTAENVEEGIAVMRRQAPDMVFLDIELGTETGFDILHAIDQPDLMVIITSAYEKYALQAVKVRVMDYILKPIYIPDFVAAIDKCQRAYDNRNDLQEAEVRYDRTKPTEPLLITVASRQSVIFIPAESILHLESKGGYTRIVTADGRSLLTSKPLKEHEEMLPTSHFIRVHQSHIVNIRCISKLERNKNMVLSLTNHTEVPVSNSRKNEVLARLMS